MIRMLAIAAEEGSPVGDLIRQNETLAGFLCIAAVVLAVLALVRFSKR